jgi:hypothetical protein
MNLVRGFLYRLSTTNPIPATTGAAPSAEVAESV